MLSKAPISSGTFFRLYMNATHRTTIRPARAGGRGTAAISRGTGSAPLWTGGGGGAGENAIHRGPHPVRDGDPGADVPGDTPVEIPPRLVAGTDVDLVEIMLRDEKGDAELPCDPGCNETGELTVMGVDHVGRELGRDREKFAGGQHPRRPHEQAGAAVKGFGQRTHGINGPGDVSRLDIAPGMTRRTKRRGAAAEDFRGQDRNGGHRRDAPDLVPEPAQRRYLRKSPGADGRIVRSREVCA